MPVMEGKVSLAVLTVMRPSRPIRHSPFGISEIPIGLLGREADEHFAPLAIGRDGAHLGKMVAEFVDRHKQLTFMNSAAIMLLLPSTLVEAAAEG